MSLLTSQEKGVVFFLLGTALLGSIIGIFRHNWFSNPEILVSPNKLPEVLRTSIESEIIQKHNSDISSRQLRLEEAPKFSQNIAYNEENTIVSQLVEDMDQNQTENNSIINKKNTTQNPSRIININSASKDDFIMLPYIGEVKAERIIQLRNEIGTFKSVKDLEMVKGIGPKTLLKIEPFITI